MAEHVPGRHRAPGRYNPLKELTAVARGAAEPALRTGAVLAASGGLVAAFALPAQATGTAAAPRVAAASLVTAPATVTAITAPSAGPVARSVGVLGVKAVAKPKPKPKPKPAPVVVIAPPTRTPAGTSRTAPRLTTPAPAPRPRPTPPPVNEPNVPAAGGVLAIAASLVGIPYVYGGSTPAGFDCSGFTMYVFAKVGISLQRTAAGQQASAARVSNPQPGDLVFFGYPAYHVGIYAGNGMMYDSPRTGLSTSLRSIWSGSVSYGRP